MRIRRKRESVPRPVVDYVCPEGHPTKMQVVSGTSPCLAWCRHLWRDEAGALQQCGVQLTPVARLL